MFQWSFNNNWPYFVDIYSYNEDDMVLDPYLEKHLAHFGINMSALEKVCIFSLNFNSLMYCFLMKFIYTCKTSQTVYGMLKGNVSLRKEGLSWSWSYNSWIYNYLWNQCLSPQKLWVWILLKRGVLDTTLCDKVCQWLAAVQVSSTNKTDHQDIAEILLKVSLNSITPPNPFCKIFTNKWNFVLTFLLTPENMILK